MIVRPAALKIRNDEEGEPVAVDQNGRQRRFRLLAECEERDTWDQFADSGEAGERILVGILTSWRAVYKRLTGLVLPFA